MHVPERSPMRAPERALIRLWGTRGTAPAPGPDTVRYGGHTSCVDVLGTDGSQVILDGGTGLRALGDHMSPVGDSVQLLLTHRHSDHVAGIPHFAPLLAGRPLHVRCGNADAASLRPLLAMLLSPPLFPELRGVNERLTTGDFTETANGAHAGAGALCVQRLPARHPGGAAVFRIDDPDGPLMAYAPDNELGFADDSASTCAWRDALAASLAGIPLLLHDATYTADELPHHTGWGHSSAEEATRFAMEAGVQRLVLLHHHPDRHDDAVDALRARCQAMAGSTLDVIAGYDGQSLTV